MNRKGFTLVELLAVLVVLGLVVGIGATSVTNIITASKEKSEATFVETIKDAVDVYLTGGEANELDYFECDSSLDGGKYADYEYATIKDGLVYKSVTFDVVVNSIYKPINKNSLINPANDNAKCFGTSGTSGIELKIYRNKKNRAYYYILDKNSGFNNCFKYTVDKQYISNMEEPETFKCV